MRQWVGNSNYQLSLERAGSCDHYLCGAIHESSTGMGKLLTAATTLYFGGRVAIFDVHELDLAQIDRGSRRKHRAKIA